MDCASSGAYAWTWNNPGYIWTDHYMTFCPPFFNSPSLSDDIAAAKSGQKNARILEYFETNRAVTFFHESFHMAYTVSDPFGKHIFPIVLIETYPSSSRRPK